MELLANKVSLEGGFMTDNFLTTVFIIALIIAFLLYIFKSKETGKYFFWLSIVVIAAFYILTLIWIGFKSIF